MKRRGLVNTVLVLLGLWATRSGLAQGPTDPLTKYWQEKRRHDQELLANYGSWEGAQMWRRGFRDGDGNQEKPSPLPKDTAPALYIAYMEGFHVGRRNRLQQGRGYEPQGTSRAEDSQLLAELYARQVEGMTSQSDRYYLLLEELKGLPPLDPPGTRPAAQVVDHTRRLLEVSRQLYAAHGLFHQHAWEAQRLHPRLVAALEARAAQLVADIPAAEFREWQGQLHVNADKAAALARRLAAEPVTVPEDFERMGRYHKEALMVIGKALEVDELHLVIDGTLLDDSGLEVGMARYTEFCLSWQTIQFNDWKANRLQRLRDAMALPPAPGPAGVTVDTVEPAVAAPDPAPVQQVVPSPAPARPADPAPATGGPSAPGPRSVEAATAGFPGWLVRIAFSAGAIALGLVGRFTLRALYSR